MWGFSGNYNMKRFIFVFVLAVITGVMFAVINLFIWHGRGYEKERNIEMNSVPTQVESVNSSK
jgi:hypothetical protein